MAQDKPQDKLEELFLNRGEVPTFRQLPDTGERAPLRKLPWKDEDPLTRFIGGFSGLDEPGGGVAGLIGAVAGAANPLDDIMRYVKNLKGTGKMAEFAATNDPRTVSKFFEGTPKRDPGRIRDRQGLKNEFPDAFGQLDTSGRLKPEPAAETARLISEMIEDPSYRAGFKEFAKRDPVAAGHVSSISLGNHPAKGFYGNLMHMGHQLPTSAKPVRGFPEAEFQSKLTLNPNSILTRFSGNERTHNVAHELQHAAQQLKEGRNFAPKYAEANRIFGYYKNPYELDANKIATDVAKTVKLDKLSGR